MDNFHFKKRLGQNFLNDKNLLNKIAAVAPIADNDLVIEIGTGMGSLTDILSSRAGHVLTFEVDKSLETYLNNKYNDSNVTVVYKDFLKADLDTEIAKLDIEYNNIYVVANIPYYITTAIIDKLLISQINISKIVLLMQNEVAKRLTANSKNRSYGATTVILNSFFDVKYEFKVSRTNFYPIPKVDSAVISLISNYKLSMDKYSKYKEFIYDAFQFKRKTLRNNLINYDLELIDNVLNKYGLSINNRAEEIDSDIFIDLFNTIS